jgi:hypothetical protein
MAGKKKVFSDYRISSNIISALENYEAVHKASAYAARITPERTFLRKDQYVRHAREIYHATKIRSTTM